MSTQASFRTSPFILWGAIIPIVIGLAAIGGWWTDSSALIRVHESWTPMVFNTALSLVSLSLALWFSHRGHFRRVYALLVLPLILGPVTLAQYILKLDFGIDNFFFSHAVAVFETKNPGRMSPLTALSIMFLSFGIFATTRNRSPGTVFLTAMALQALTLIQALTAVLGYSMNLEAALQWGTFNKMAFNTTVSLIILSSTVLYQLYINHKQELLDTRPLLKSAGTGMSCLVLTLFLWQALARHEIELFQHSRQEILKTTVDQFSLILKDHISALNRLAQRMSRYGADQGELQKLDIEDYFRTYPAILEVAHFDSEGKLTIIQSREERQPPLSESHRELASKVQSAIPDDIQVRYMTDAKSMYVLIPAPGQKPGIYGIRVDHDKLLETLLTPPGYRVSIASNSHGIQDVDPAENASLHTQLKIYGHIWNVTLQPGLEAIKNYQSRLPEWILATGILISLLIATLTQLLLQLKSKERLLLVSEKLLKDSNSGSRDGLWAFDLLTGQAYLSPQWLHMLGYDSGDHLTDFESVRSLVHPDDHETTDQMFNSHLSGILPHFEAEVRLKNKQGAWQWMLIRGKASSYDENGRPLRIAGTQSEITRKKEMEMSLKQSEKRLQNFMDFAPVGIMVLDKSGKCRFANWAWSHTADMLLLEAFGDGWLKAVHPDDVQRVEHELAAAMREHRPLSLEFRLQRPDGTVRTVLSKSIELTDDQNNVHSHLATVQDITDLRQAEYQALLYKNCLDATDIVAFTDARGRITHSNQRFCEISGYELHELLGKDHRILNSGIMGKEFFKSMWRTISSGAIWRGEICNRSKSGRLYWVDTTIIPVLDNQGRINQYVSIRHDITEKKIQEKQLSETLLKAEDAARTKSLFLANMSHEIRTPLNGVIGLTRVLSDTNLNEEQRKTARSIQQCADNLLALVNDILDFSKIEAGKLVLEDQPFNLHLCLDEAMSLMSLRAKDKGLELNLHIAKGVPQAVIGDVTRLRQIILNLLTNAVKFTPSGFVRVHADARTLQDDHCEITVAVEDSGIGLSPDQQSRLFGVFSQADSSTTRRFGGTGLGLAICRTLCEAMGGRIWIRSALQKGSTFTFTIQMKLADTLLIAAENPTKEDAHDLAEAYPLSILVAEDNHINQQVAKSFFKKLGYEVDIAANGLEACEAASRLTYDFIFMDLHMPEMDGIEATQTILSRNKEPVPVIIAMTAAALQEDKASCLAAGMKDYITKPITLTSIVTVLKRHMAMSSSSVKVRELSHEHSFDRSALLSEFKGSERVLTEILQLYFKDFSQAWDALAEAANQKDFKSIEEKSHLLKGVISNFKAISLQMALNDIEKSARDHDMETLQRRLSKFKARFYLFNEQLHGFLDELTGQAA